MRCIVLCLLLAGTAGAETLVVGTKPAPPFVLKENDRWTGISIELWRRVATDLGIESEFREYDLKGLLAATEKGEVDVAAAALTMTPEREETMDFTHSFHNAGLGIAVPAGEAGRGGILDALFSRAFVEALGALLVVLLAAGVLVWLFERRRNEEFGGDAARGIGAGFWWSAVTMTTVGYGDKSPKTLGGRTVGFVWMFASVIVIATFTGAIASALTMKGLASAIQGPDDLAGRKVAAVRGSTSESFLRGRGIRTLAVADVEAALKAVGDGDADAAVHDAPMLRYLTLDRFGDTVQTLPRQFQRQDYAFALPDKSPHRERINRALLRVLESPDWQDVLARYLGG